MQNVLQKDGFMDYICVIGGANVDITCVPYEKLRLKDSNPGRVGVCCGGVGRNIAENLSRLGQNVKLITALGNDANANYILENARLNNIDLSFAAKTDLPTSCYIAMDDVDGDMFVSLSAMDCMNALDENYLKSVMDIINGAKCVVADSNLTQGLVYLLQNVRVPVFFDAVSCSKLSKCKERLQNVFCLKVNRDEAFELSGTKVTDEQSAKRCFDKTDGIANLFVSCGADGVYCVNSSGVAKVDCIPSKSVNANGAGDSFFAGCIWGYVNELDMLGSAQIGCACGSITVSSEETVSDKLDSITAQKHVADFYKKSVNGFLWQKA